MRNAVISGCIAAAAGLTLMFSTWGVSPAAGGPSRWRKIGDDLERAEFIVNKFPFFSSGVTLIRTRLFKYRIGTIRAEEYGWRRASVKSMCRARRGVSCINANFFDEQGKALGLVMSQGVIHQRIHKQGNTLTGIFQSGRRETKIVSRSMFEPSSVLEAVQAGPRLIVKGMPTEGQAVSSPSRRAGVCIDDKGRVLFFVAASGLRGLSIDQLQKLLRHPEINCVDALNLDGGGSAQLYVSGDVPGAPSGSAEIYVEGTDEVPVALALIRND